MKIYSSRPDYKVHPVYCLFASLIFGLTERVWQKIKFPMANLAAMRKI